MSALHGITPLTRLALRRDRFKLPAYVLGLGALMAGMLAMQSGEPYEALVEEAELFAGTPAMRIFGVASGASVGATLLLRGYMLLAVLAGVLSTLTVVRHSRQNEETGRAELSAPPSSGATRGWGRHSSSRSARTPRSRRRSGSPGS